MLKSKTRFQEWRALYDYCYENREALEKRGLMKPFVLCMQAHWHEALRLREEENTS